jgi:hypothetical protein
VARACGVSQGWVSRLVARYRAEGEAAFEPRFRFCPSMRDFSRGLRPSSGTDGRCR